MELVLGFNKGAHSEGKLPELLRRGLCLCPAAELYGLPVLHGKLQGHAALSGIAVCGDLPVLLGNERPDLTLALDDELDSH